MCLSAVEVHGCDGGVLKKCFFFGLDSICFHHFVKRQISERLINDQKKLSLCSLFPCLFLIKVYILENKLILYCFGLTLQYMILYKLILSGKQGESTLFYNGLLKL